MSLPKTQINYHFMQINLHKMQSSFYLATGCSGNKCNQFSGYPQLISLVPDLNLIAKY